MLVVIAIIGILAAILVPTLYRVVDQGAADQDRPGAEPNCTWRSSRTSRSSATIRRISPRSRRPTDFDDQRQPFGRPAPPQGVSAPHGEPARRRFRDGPAATSTKPDPAEALVFWLSQLWDDPRQPLTGSGKRIVLFPFDEKRLVDPDRTRRLQMGCTAICRRTARTRRTSTSTAGSTPMQRPFRQLPAPRCQSVRLQGRGGNAVVVSLRDQADERQHANPLSMANPTTYQIISAGLDGEYGDVRASPRGPPAPTRFSRSAPTTRSATWTTSPISAATARSSRTPGMNARRHRTIRPRLYADRTAGGHHGHQHPGQFAAVRHVQRGPAGQGVADEGSDYEAARVADDAVGFVPDAGSPCPNSAGLRSRRRRTRTRTRMACGTAASRMSTATRTESTTGTALQRGD